MEAYRYIAKRPDDTYEVGLAGSGFPYHVTETDERYPELAALSPDLPPGAAMVLRQGQDDGEIPLYDMVEDHRGASGWINGRPHVITDFGPLPSGWSASPPLEDEKQRALAALKTRRLAVEYAGPLVTVAGRPLRFPSEVKDETRLNSLAGLFMADPTAQIPDWKVADGVYVTMTAPLLQAIKVAGFAHIAATFSVERQKRAEVEALETVEAVQAWRDNGGLDTGWPE